MVSMTKTHSDGAQPVPSTTDQPPSAVARLVSAVWRGLANPVLLLALTLVAFALVLAALMMPQMPHPIYADPAAAARWLLSTGSQFGSAGELWSALGLFNLQHSTLLRLLLILIALMLAVQLADQIGSALTLSRVASRLNDPAREPASPIRLPKGGPIYRERSAFPVAIEALSNEVAAHLAARFGETERTSVDVIDSSVESAGQDEGNAEDRVLATRAKLFAYLRPLLPLGLLVGLLALWLNITFGWEVISPILAPTESFQYPPRNLDIRYPTAIEDSAGFAVPKLQMTLNGREEALVVGAINQAGRNRIITRSSVPALLVRTTAGDVPLERPGDPAKQQSQTLGLSFATPGSEESLILPDQGIGVRIIRRPISASPEKTEDDGVYSVEIYEANSAAPAERLPLDAMKPETIDVADGDVTLEFLPTVGVVVAVRSEPGSPLDWLAGLLTIIGLVGFVRVPAYLLAQVGEWSPTKAFVIAQSNSKRELLSLETSLNQPETARPAPATES